MAYHRACFGFMAVLGALGATANAPAADRRPGDARAERQWTIQHVLNGSSPAGVARARSSCASGQQPASIAERRAVGSVGLPDAADYCVTVLTRLGRDGALGFVRDASNAALTPALAFDNGFVTAYRRREAVPAGLPSMAEFKPLAERCLAQAERDTDLCFSAGYGYGLRAANGETVVVGQ